MISVLYVMLTVVGCLFAISCATWLLIERLRHKENKARSYWRWVTDMFDALLGL